MLMSSILDHPEARKVRLEPRQDSVSSLFVLFRPSNQQRERNMYQSHTRSSGIGPERRPAARRTRLIAGLAALAIVATLAACSGSTSQPTVATLQSVNPGQPSPSASGEFDFQQSVLDFASCMRDHGIDMADPEFGADGMPDFRKMIAGMDFSNPKFTDARQACGGMLAGLAMSTDPAVQAEWQQALVDFAGCMRDNGIDMADPQPGTGPFRNLASLDPNSPKFEAAYEACSNKLSGINQ
jgi:hypothetical protein